MDISDKIRLADLLLQRDEAFVRVAECERQIQGILGAPYPFPPLPELPSLRRKKPAKRAGADVPRAEIRLRALKRPEENAYRVGYLRGGEPAVSFMADADLLRRLIALDAPEFRITSVVTVSLCSPEEAVPVAELWREVRAAEGG